jgi:hypothetical protein
MMSKGAFREMISNRVVWRNIELWGSRKHTTLSLFKDNRGVARIDEMHPVEGDLSGEAERDKHDHRQLRKGRWGDRALEP